MLYRSRARLAVRCLVCFCLCLGWVSSMVRADQRWDSEHSPVDALVESIDDSELSALVEDVLDRNPDLAAAMAQARAAEAAAEGITWPDPRVDATLYLAPPETRVGAQRLRLAVGQTIPWFGKLDLEDRIAAMAVVAAQAAIDAHRLELVTEVRRLAIELAFLDQQRRLTMEYRDHLIRHEELARSRYSTGLGQGQGVVKMQSEITRAESDLLTLETRSRSLRTRLNMLRDLGPSEPLAIEFASALIQSQDRALQPLGGGMGTSNRLSAQSTQSTQSIQWSELADRAVARRPEMDAVRAEIAGAEARAELAARQQRPDVSVGLTYALVERRDDRAARVAPPSGSGNDVFGLTGSMRLPFLSHSRSRIAADIRQAEALSSAAQSRLMKIERELRAEVDDLVQRLPLLRQQVHLIGDLLILQAEESVRSAEAGYSSGRLEALDLFDAEHVLFEAQVAGARARADLAIAIAELEGAISEPLAESLRSRSEPSDQPTSEPEVSR